jgi:heptosyltransferase-3
MYTAITKFLAIHQYAFINGVLDLLRNTLFQSPHELLPKKILIVRKGTLGDIITCIPILLSIKKKFPNAQLDILTQDFGQKSISAQEIVPDDLIHDCISLSTYSFFKLFQTIKAKHYDWVIELPQTQDTIYTQWRNMLFFRFCQIPVGIGWEVISTFVFRKAQLTHVQFKDETSRLFLLLQRCGAGIEKLESYRIKLPTTIEKQTVDEKLASIDNKLAIIAIGAKHDRKRWPLSYFIQVATNLKDQGFHTIWVGDASDEKHLLEHTHIGSNWCGQLSVAQSAYIFTKASLFVGNDSGPMHLAYACQLPVVAIFSARDYPGKWFPPSFTRHEILSDYNVPCAICVGKSCSTNICMQNIQVAQVMDRIKRVLL